LKLQCDTHFVPQVHRRILYDDSWGVDEALNETAFGIGLVARGRHYVTAGAINGVSPNIAAQERELANRKLLSPWLFFSPGGTSFESWRANYKMEVRVQYTGCFFSTGQQF
jgi:lysosomal alpha-mannosidase